MLIYCFDYCMIQSIPHLVSNMVEVINDMKVTSNLLLHVCFVFVLPRIKGTFHHPKYATSSIKRIYVASVFQSSCSSWAVHVDAETLLTVVITICVAGLTAPPIFIFVVSTCSSASQDIMSTSRSCTDLILYSICTQKKHTTYK